jgi:hypothetical protein
VFDTREVSIRMDLDFSKFTIRGALSPSKMRKWRDLERRVERLKVDYMSGRGNLVDYSDIMSQIVSSFGCFISCSVQCRFMLIKDLPVCMVLDNFEQLAFCPNVRKLGSR